MASENSNRSLPRELAFAAAGAVLILIGMALGGGMRSLSQTDPHLANVARRLPPRSPLSALKLDSKDINALASILKNTSPYNGSSIVAGKSKLTLRWDPDYHIFRAAGKPIIWVFWNKEEIPTLIKASLGTIACFNNKDFHIQVVHESDIHLWIDHVHPAFQYLIPAHKADYFRGRILDVYGGVYLDADTLGFASMWQLFQKLLWYDVVNMSWPPDGDAISITNMGPVRARTHFTSKWVTNLHLLLDKKLGQLEGFGKNGGNYPIQWAEILRGIVVPLVDKLLKESLSFSFFSMTGHRTFGQFVSSGYDPTSKLSQMDKGPFSFTKYELLIYHNSGISEEIRTMPLADFLNSDIIIAELVRTAFRVCQADRTSRVSSNRILNPTEIKIQPRINTDGLASLKSFITQFLDKQTFL